MTSTLLDISETIDPLTRSALQLVTGQADKLGIPILVIGATARDLVLRDNYGAEVERATHDLDFAIQVPDWPSFNALTGALLEVGFESTKRPHRLEAQDGGWVDLVPFGPVASEDRSIEWPPSGDTKMTVLGFQEAFDHALSVQIAADSVLKVVSPAGLALLKWVSWTERAVEDRPRDANDLIFLCRSYQAIPSVADEMYENPEIMGPYDWDPSLGSAKVLGQHVRKMAKPETQVYLAQHFGPDREGSAIRALVRESYERDRIGTQAEQHKRIFNAFLDGYLNS